MRVIIAGSRDGATYVDVALAMGDALKSWGHDPHPAQAVIGRVLSGRARGVDSLGEAWARTRRIPIEFHPADWKQHGKRAGILRNVEMAQSADALVAVWDGKSRGTKHMIDEATKRGLKVFVRRLDQQTRDA